MSVFCLLLSRLSKSHLSTSTTATTVIQRSAHHITTNPSRAVKLLTLDQSCGSFSYGVASTIGTRKTQEDAWIASPPSPHPVISGLHYSIFGVFDGHGNHGWEVSRFCADNFVGVFQTTQGFLQGNFEAALTQALPEVDKKFTRAQLHWCGLSQEQIERFMTDDSREGDVFRQGFVRSRANNKKPASPALEMRADAGTTAHVVVVLQHTHALDKAEIVVANAGDSRSVLFDGAEGSSIPLSADHTSDDVNEVKRIKSCGGECSQGWVTDANGLCRPSRLLGKIGSRVLGNFLDPTKQVFTPVPEIKKTQVSISNGNCLLIATDGLWGPYDEIPKELPSLISFLHSRINNNNSNHHNNNNSNHHNNNNNNNTNNININNDSKLKHHHQPKSGLLLSGVCEEIFQNCFKTKYYTEWGGDNITAVLVKFHQ